MSLYKIIKQSRTAVWPLILVVSLTAFMIFSLFTTTHSANTAVSPQPNNLVPSASLQPNLASPFTETAKLTGEDGLGFDRFGFFVALDGDTAMVSAFSVDSSDNVTDEVYIFTRTGSAWSQQQRLVSSDANDGLSGPIALGGHTAVVAGTQAVYVFTQSGGLWSEQAKLVPNHAMGQWDVVNAVALDGDTAVFSISHYDSEGNIENAVYVFSRTGALWQEEQSLPPVQNVADNNFGIGLALQGDTLVVGDSSATINNTNRQGAAYVFTRSNGLWTEQQMLLAPDGQEDSFFGVSVAIDAQTIAVGAPGGNLSQNAQGAVYVFTRINDTWAHSQKLTTSDGEEYTYLGWERSLDLDGNTLAVGAYGANSLGRNDQGAAFVFVRANESAPWSEQSKLIASDGEAEDNFGWALALDTDTLIIGGSFHFRDDPAGAAYVFTRTAKSQYPLFVSTIGTGTGNVAVTPDLPLYDHGTVVTLTAVADPDSTFSGWNGTVTSTTNPITLTMTMTHVITATFALNQYPLSVSTAGNGSGSVALVPDLPLYDHGTVVTLTAVADLNSTFSGWSGTVTSTTNPITLTINAPYSIIATFEANNVALIYTTYLPLIIASPNN